MKKENVPIVEPIGKDEHSVYCPFCGSEHWFPEKGGKIEEITRERDGFVQRIKHRRDDVVCEDCGNEYIIDFGEESYTIYNPPKIINSNQELLSKFESKWHYNFEIIISDLQPKIKDKIYKVECENDGYSFLLSSPLRGAYKDPLEILKLGETYADTEVYPNFTG